MRALLLFLLLACSAPAYSQPGIQRLAGIFKIWLSGSSYLLQRDMPKDADKYDFISLDTARYDLYVRMICTEYRNIADKTYDHIPCDCGGDTSRKNLSIENEYLLLPRDPKTDPVLVINYLKNKGKEKYNKTATEAYVPSDLITINLNDLNQLRVGRRSQDTLYFRLNDEGGREDLWLVDTSKKTVQMRVRRVSTVVTDGVFERHPDELLDVSPVYHKFDRFQVVFRRLNEVYGAHRNDAYLAISREQRGFSFSFGDTIKTPRNNWAAIGFKRQRLYSYNQYLYGCASCYSRYVCTGFLYDKYKFEQKKLISENWFEFNGPLLSDDLRTSSRAPEITLRLDAVGCVYPNTIRDNFLQTRFLNDFMKRHVFGARTFFQLIKTHSKGDPYLDPGIRETLERYADTTVPTRPDSILLFRDLWNSVYLKAFTRNLADAIEQNRSTRVVFFIHGYNVPYSLAHLQGNDIIDDYMDKMEKRNNTENILFVRVFWPSNDAKTIIYQRNGCVVNNDPELSSGKMFKTLGSSASLIALTLRDIINQQDSSLKMEFITHSFGAAIATRVVLPPGKTERVPQAAVRRYLDQAFKVTPPIKQRTTMYLNAPGISGQHTFAGLDPEVNKNHQFYIAYNNNDKVLNKKFVLNLRLISPNRKGPTSLGCNYQGDVEKTVAIVKAKGLERNFITEEVSHQRNHDYFCYRQQQGFKGFFARYVNASHTTPMNLVHSDADTEPATGIKH